MPEPQPGAGQPAGRSEESPIDPTADPSASAAGEPPGPAAEPSGPTAEPSGPTAEPTGPAADEPSAPQPAAGDEAPAGAQPTDVVPPRWSGSAPVPPAAGPRKRRWLATEEVDAQPPPPPAARPNPTLELPAHEREELENQDPVDPWADADAGVIPWHGHPGAWAGPAGPWDDQPGSWGDQPDAWDDQPGSWTSPQPPGLPQTLPYPMPGPPPTAAAPAGWPAPHSPAPPQPPAVAYPPAGAPPAPRSPAARPSGRRGRRSRKAPPPQPPADSRPPRGYVPVPVRRRRRWPWLMSLLILACCCVCPGYFGRPMWEQYPASATVPAQVADLTLRDDATSTRATQRLEQDMRVAHTFAEGTFAGVYSAPGGKQVTVFGTTGFRVSPNTDVDAEIARLTDTYQLTAVRPVPTKVRDESRRCGTGRAGDTDLVLCSWADHGSLGTGLFTGRSIEDSADLLAQLRSAIVTRG